MSTIFALLPLILALYVAYLIIRRSRNNDDAVDPLTYLDLPKDLLIIVVLAVLAFNVFVYEATTGIGYAVFFAVCVLCVYLSISKEKRILLAKLTLLIGVCASLLIAVRANGALQFLDFVVLFASAILLLLIKITPNTNWHGLWLFRRAGEYVMYASSNITTLIRSRGNKQGEGVNVVGIIKTVVITFVVLFVFAQILSSADPVFSQTIQTIKEQAFARTVFSLIIASFFVVALSVKLSPKEDEEFDVPFLSYNDIFIPAAALCALIALFIFVQAKYLFGGSVNLEAYGLNYSEYVRKGFIELIVATSIGGFIA
ncbi:DUF4173 domain-containing protein, partial [candidate division WWE3 bacterium]|nr:DUF4173 domain-containing protein [candidate division WWE3 bacterium]